MTSETFQRICAWCKAKLEGHDASAEKVSHGICPECADEQRQLIKRGVLEKEAA